jgi:hypothetical protein
MRKTFDAKKAIRLNAVDKKILMIYSSILAEVNRKEDKETQKESRML